jgi:hypothetical protein
MVVVATAAALSFSGSRGELMVIPVTTGGENGVVTSMTDPTAGIVEAGAL